MDFTQARLLPLVLVLFNWQFADIETQRNIIHSPSKSWKPGEAGGAPKKPSRRLKWEGSVFITFLIQEERESKKEQGSLTRSQKEMIMWLSRGILSIT